MGWSQHCIVTGRVALKDRVVLDELCLVLKVSYRFENVGSCGGLCYCARTVPDNVPCCRNRSTVRSSTWGNSNRAACCDTAAKMSSTCRVTCDHRARDQ